MSQLQHAFEGALLPVPVRIIASLVGVKATTPRPPKRFDGLTEPKRTATSHRSQSRNHAQAIRRVFVRVQDRVPISRVRDIPDAGPAPAERSDPTKLRYRRSMRAAVTRFDGGAPERTCGDALSLGSVAAGHGRLVPPLVGDLGRLCRHADAAIAEEHRFATYLRRRPDAWVRHRTRDAGGRRLIAACLPGERHEIDLLHFGLGAHEVDFHTLMLGADKPLGEVARVHRQVAARAVPFASSIDPPTSMLEEDLPTCVRAVAVPVYVDRAVSERHARAIGAAGPCSLGGDIDTGIDLFTERLIAQERAS